MLRRLLGLLGSDLAIDLGTANTLISVKGEGLVVNEPSVVAVEEGTRRVVSGGCAVGHLAKQMQGRTGQSISVVRPMAAGVIADYQLCEAMLRYFIRKAGARGLGVRPRVLVALPGCITPVEKRAVFNSAERAGAREVLVMSEAKAAAIGAALPVAEPVASMICDVGGGTTEVAVLSLGEIVAQRSIRIAGDAMDQALVEYLKRHYSLKVSMPAAERLRIEIGSAQPLEDELCDEVRGIDAVSGLPRKATITSEEVREALGGPLLAIVDAIKATLDDCTTDLASDLAENGVVLAGGGALLRGLDRYITAQTGLPARLCADPLTAVARGTYICLNHFDRWRSVMQSSDEDV
ncbi:MAG TPA: rod shape-determining protein [Pirellulales bacterium]|jgi:rod shape-determining protein MreB|nr:rod shape-determining protein [Pirellulales bacterium]